MVIKHGYSTVDNYSPTTSFLFLPLTTSPPSPPPLLPRPPARLSPCGISSAKTMSDCCECVAVVRNGSTECRCETCHVWGLASMLLHTGHTVRWFGLVCLWLRVIRGLEYQKTLMSKHFADWSAGTLYVLLTVTVRAQRLAPAWNSATKTQCAWIQNSEKNENYKLHRDAFILPTVADNQIFLPQDQSMFKSWSQRPKDSGKPQLNDLTPERRRQLRSSSATHSPFLPVHHCCIRVASQVTFVTASSCLIQQSVCVRRVRAQP